MIVPGLQYIKLTKYQLGLGLLVRTADIVLVLDNRVNREVKVKVDKKIMTFLVEEPIDFIQAYLQMNADQESDKPKIVGIDLKNAKPLND